MRKILLPPFDVDSASAMVKAIEDVCNTTSPSDVVQLLSEEILWIDAQNTLKGRKAITNFLFNKRKEQLKYYTVKELLSYDGCRISTRSEAEWMCAKTRQWIRTCQDENWEVNESGLISRLEISARDTVILERQRKYRR